MELYQLEYFRTLCRCESYSRAARLLFVSQPAVSSAIRKLEEECGGQLIKHTAGSFEITQLGQALLTGAEKIHVEMDVLQNELASVRDKNNDVIRISIPASLFPDLIPDLYQDFLALHPDIHLSIFQKSQPEAKNALLDGSLDMAILIMEDSFPKFWSTLSLGRQELLYYCAPSCPLYGSSQVTPKDIAGFPLLMTQQKYGIGKKISDYLELHDSRPEILQVGGMTGLLRMIDAGIGSSIAPASALEISGIKLQYPLYLEQVLVWNHRQALTGNRRLLMQFISDYCKEGLS